LLHFHLGRVTELFGGTSMAYLYLAIAIIAEVVGREPTGKSEEVA
jgi:hypothetical protein